MGFASFFFLWNKFKCFNYFIFYFVLEPSDTFKQCKLELLF